MDIRSWKFHQYWKDIHFFHFQVDSAFLENQIPEGLTLDTYNGQAYLTYIWFRMEGLRHKGIPAIPIYSTFYQFNCRTYVYANGERGVYLFKALVSKKWIPFLAGYVSSSPFSFGSFEPMSNAGRVIGKDGFDFEFSVEKGGSEALSTPLNSWLLDRYSLFEEKNGQISKLNLHHAPWTFRSVNTKELSFQDPFLKGQSLSFSLGHACTEMEVWLQSRVLIQ